ncbi:MAG: glycerol-3-phosphate dehydrogenase, partial [Solirubrobacteraceae bacterium]|nr:glycerol-3-phosphate dehydrogenase [Solirubrobacteraceae bacterium]
EQRHGLQRLDGLPDPPGDLLARDTVGQQLPRPPVAALRRERGGDEVARPGQPDERLGTGAEALGARPESFIGRAGTGDLVATALAPQSRNRRAGELLAAGVPAADIPGRIGQTVESLESVPLLARALNHAGLEAPVTDGLAKLISGELPLDDWVALVRTTVPPPPARWRPVAVGFWTRLQERTRARLGRPGPAPS